MNEYSVMKGNYYLNAKINHKIVKVTSHGHTSRGSVLPFNMCFLILKQISKFLYVSMNLTKIRPKFSL